MIKYVNGKKVEYEEILPEEPVINEKEYWANISYDEAVNSKIRERYTESQEFAILRQKDEKPEEYAIYYSYCEDCKAFVKEMRK